MFLGLSSCCAVIPSVPLEAAAHLAPSVQGLGTTLQGISTEIQGCIDLSAPRDVQNKLTDARSLLEAIILGLREQIGDFQFTVRLNARFGEVTTTLGEIFPFLEDTEDAELKSRLNGIQNRLASANEVIATLFANPLRGAAPQVAHPAHPVQENVQGVQGLVTKLHGISENIQGCVDLTASGNVQNKLTEAESLLEAIILGLRGQIGDPEFTIRLNARFGEVSSILGGIFPLLGVADANLKGRLQAIQRELAEANVTIAALFVE
ncbi:hypothetical protein AGMMS49949_02100 [Alphaproteobacteria bacterium]|nr:hypothetical protein AGMMS49949_02100 [Alphaproteobacteria bacterium]GHS95905.1 hypothetical protein AGMMS50296_1390 [Alphaproteobacteria bacterium]